MKNRIKGKDLLLLERILEIAGEFESVPDVLHKTQDWYRKDLNYFDLDVEGIAGQFGFQGLEAMILAGAYVESTRSLSSKAVEVALVRILGEDKVQELELHMQAFELGKQIVHELFCAYDMPKIS
ncbi:hypothetical protein [Anaerotalea alkaliphila]|uniref:Uncharacterized protein n=1 Tax=Anaerotalea alkaliphila TaxID=2662126 RepID=A0A7X5HXJ5_9FIRM|nr:hypothetical protein [Anaerotalea alkaliphila]NDL68336.1 hypothetical protein [Anaerotalea alkaliphila]